MDNSKDCISLSQQEMNSSLSARNKKRKTVKAVLMSPLPPPFARLQEVSEDFNTVLERELAVACLTRGGETEIDPKTARKGLAIGVNAVCRQLHKRNVSAVIVASDIHPESLVGHLILKTHYYEVPTLRSPKLRSITKQSLGFECISVGFTKASELFKKIVDLVVEQCPVKKTKPVDNEVEEKCVMETPSHVKPKERTFELLKRSCRTTRTFIPQRCPIKPPEENLDFISINSQSLINENIFEQSTASAIVKRPFNGPKAELGVTPPKKYKQFHNMPRPPFVAAKVERINSNVNRKRKMNKFNKNKK